MITLRLFDSSNSIKNFQINIVEFSQNESSLNLEDELFLLEPLHLRWEVFT